MMTGNGVMHNGTTILDEYGHNLDRLKVSHFLCFNHHSESFLCSKVSLTLSVWSLFSPAGR